MNFWETMLLPALRGIADQIMAIMPNILAAVVILLIGWITARLFTSLVRKLLQKVRFDTLTERTGISGFLRNAGFARDPSWILGTLVFWLLMLTFVLSAANVLHLSLIAETIQKLVSFIPNIIAVVFIVVFGALFGRFVGRLIRGAATELGLDMAEFLGKLVNNLIIIMVVVIAINQLEIKSGILEITFAAVLGAFGLAVSITLGLGTRSISQNIVSGVYARKSFRAGQRVKLKDVEGDIIEIGTVNTRIRGRKETVSIPNAMLIEETTSSRNSDGA